MSDEETSRKRVYSMDSESSAVSPSSPRPRLNIHKDLKSDLRSLKSNEPRVERWITNCMTDDYVDIVGDIMYPKCSFGSSNVSEEEPKLPFEKLNTLGYLLNPIRHRTVLEKWCPFEVAVFEASICLYGKNFHEIAKKIETKTCKEVIEFYYEWKKTHHYEQWKKTYKNYAAEERASSPHTDLET
mmetsp:Transcript_12527/g.18916  ORF Transcript_12527/g.18916 Transcript_12527/m.18916 type:complete len:185 (-) Transcript_12527:230-784(-)